jgi:hypothetical protein
VQYCLCHAESRGLVGSDKPFAIDRGLHRDFDEAIKPTGHQTVDHVSWQLEADGQLSAAVQNLRLVIRKAEGCVRYLILRRSPRNGGFPEIMLSSGTESNLDAAMMAARRVAIRIESILAERQRIAALFPK